MNVGSRVLCCWAAGLALHATGLALHAIGLALHAHGSHMLSVDTTTRRAIGLWGCWVIGSDSQFGPPHPPDRPTPRPSQCVPLVGQLIEAATVEGSPLNAALSLKLDGSLPAGLVVAAPPRVSPAHSRASVPATGSSPTPSRTSPPPAH